MLTTPGFWMIVAGVAVLVLGVVCSWGRLRAARGIERLVVLGPVLEGVPLVAFGVEHMRAGQRMAGGVPSWIPGHLFWIYFVGAALIAGGLSLATGRYVRWSALLFAAMMMIFVLTIHLPNVVKEPAARPGWMVLFREPGFSGGALALASLYWPRQRGVLLTVGRVLVAFAVIFFGVESLLHPEVVPGIPLEKLMPAWYPGHQVLTPLCGVVLIVAGVAMFTKRWARSAAICAGVLMVALTAVFYVPVLIAEMQTIITEGANYVFDTLLFGASALLVAMALPRRDEMK